MGAATVAAVLLGSAGIEARSSMGDAIVTQAGGQPCFAVPARAGVDMRLFGISVTDPSEPRSDWRAPPVEMWGFAIDYPGLSMASGAADCIRYGQAPAGSRERQGPRPLKPATPYRVDINARPRDGGGANMVGYTARFCIKALASGAVEVQVAPAVTAPAKPSIPAEAAVAGAC